MPSLALPSVVKFRPDLWDSRPFDENYLRTLYVKKFYKLDEAECRITLINVLSVLDRYGILETEMQRQMEESISSMLCLLAMNIRSRDDLTPLVDLFNEQETLADSQVVKGMERPISTRHQLSVELQNAVRNVQLFEIIAPAVAWEAIRYFAGKGCETGNSLEDKRSYSGAVPMLSGDTVSSEIARWRRMGIEVAVPRGCLRFLEKRLPQLEDFTLRRRDVLSLVKSTALFLKKVGPAAEDVGDLMLRQQLQRFTRVFIADGLGAWSLVDDITKGQPKRLHCFMETLSTHRAEFAQQSAELLRSLDILLAFASTTAAQVSFSQSFHLCYSVQCGMLSYLSVSQNHNRVLVQCLQNVKSRLMSCQPKDNASSSHCKDDTATVEEGTRPIDRPVDYDADELAMKISKVYEKKCASMRENEIDSRDDKLEHFTDFWVEDTAQRSSEMGRSSKKKRNRKR